MCTQKISVNISSDFRKLNLIQIKIGFPLEYYIDCIEAKRRSELIIHENPISNINRRKQKANEQS